MLRALRESIITSIFVSIFIAVLAMVIFAMPTDAAINNQINFQGKITNPNGTNVTNGSYTFVFSIYTVSSGGSNVWTESKSLTVTDGIFQTALGDTTALPGSVDFNGSSLYLGVTVGADAEMTPRVRLTAAPYAFNSDLLDGLDSTGFIRNQTGQQATSNFNVSGTGIASIFQAGTFDTATAVALGIGSTNATVINLNQNTALAATKSLTVTSGASSLTGLAAGSSTTLAVATNATTNKGLTIQGSLVDVDAVGNSEFGGYLDTSFGGFGPYANLLLRSEQFDNAAWTKTNVTAPTANTIISPDGMTTAESLADSASGGSVANVTATVPTNNVYTFSVWLKSPSGTQTVGLRIDGSTAGTGTVTNVTATTTWQRFYVSQNTNGFTGFIRPMIFPGGVAGTGTVHAWGAQLALASTPQVYSSTTSTTIASATGIAINGNALLLSTDGANLEVHIGNTATDATQVLLQLDSFDTFVDTAACTTTSNQGGLYYNTKSNAIRACINGGWEDLVSTASLGLQLFGVVPDSGVDPGDLASVTSAVNINGPCRVAAGANLQTVSWTACTAFSGGRKVIVAAGTAGTTNAGAGNFQHLCLTGTDGQPVLSTAGAETANLATASMPSVTAPILCLADIRYAAANNTITQIYDTRTYTTTEKIPVTVNSATVLGSIVVTIATKGVVQTVAAANSNKIAGVLVATTGAAATTTINGILATSGPASVKAITGTNTVNEYIATSGTAGYAITVVQKPGEGVGTIYNILGTTRTAWTGATACAVNSNACAGSVLTYIDKR
jgi:hypothetical protein